MKQTAVMRAALRWSHTVLVALLLWAAATPSSGESALARQGQVVSVEVAASAASAASARRSELPQRARRALLRRAPPPRVAALRSRWAQPTRRIGACSPVLRAAPALYIRNCVLLR